MLKRFICIILVLSFAMSPVFCIPAEAAKSNEQIIYEYLVNDIGFNVAQACGVLANIHEESRFDPKAYCIDVDGLPSYGLCQWHVTRLDALMEYCEENNLDYTTVEGQMKYLKHELNTTEKYAFSMMLGIPNNADGAYDAGYNWVKYFGRGATLYYEYRGNLAKTDYWPRYGGHSSEKIYATVAEGDYYIKNLSSGNYITVPSHAQANGTDVATSVLEVNNYFKIKVTKGTYGYVLKPVFTESAVVNIYATIVVDGKNVTLYSPTGHTSQEWYFDPFSGGYAIVSVQNPDVVMDLSNKSVIVKNFSEAATQSWMLIPVKQPAEVTPTVTPGSDVTETVISWEPAEYADRYELTVTNLPSGTKVISTELTDTTYSVLLEPGLYSAKVTSINTALIDTGNYKTAGAAEFFNVEASHVHSFNGRQEIITDSTCSKTGLKRVYCSGSDCDEYIEVEIPKKDHQYETRVIPATKESDGVILNICGACKHVEQERFLPKYDGTSPLLEVTDTSASAGQDFDVTISLKNISDFESGSFSLNFGDGLTLKSVSCICLTSVTKNGNVISFTRRASYPANAEIICTFSADKDATGSTSVGISFTKSAFKSLTGGDIYPAVSSGTVTFVPYVYYGDANSDGEINMKDILVLRRHVAGLGVSDTFSESRSDVNGDGEINMKDILLLRRFVAGLITSFPATNK